MMNKKIKRAIIIGAILVPAFFIAVIAVTVSTVISDAAAGSTAAQAVETSETGCGTGSLSNSVLAYQPFVSQYCQKYGIPGYTYLVLAVMQQESGGTGSDPMQCSESPLNMKYSHSPNSIKDPSYSVEVGVEYLASCIRAAGCKSPSDMQGISLALQGYNFGGGYIAWAKARGGYSTENAMQFSSLKASEMGWKGYGDPQYVSHVLRYYTGGAGSGTFALPLKKGTYRISRGWGMDGSEFHKGIDFAAPAGTNIYAAAAGTVIVACYGQRGSGYGGYGNVVVIQHNSTYSTLYGHAEKLLVKRGQKVTAGQVIALVGSTGRSTGNHCHFEIRVHGNQVDPATYIKP
jgi:hypothetical protein